MTSVDFKVFAVVPARGGSKGFPRKNLAFLGDKTLLEHAIGFAKSTGGVHEVIVSSDSSEVLQIAREMGAKEHVRSEELAGDAATATEVVKDIISFLTFNESASKSDYILYLQPTSPLRTSLLLAESLELASEGHKSVISVSEASRHPMKSLTITQDGKCVPLFNKSHLSANRQSLPQAYFADGNIFLFEIGHFLTEGVFPIAGSAFVVSPEGRGTDVDSEIDLKFAEFLIERKFL